MIDLVHLQGALAVAAHGSFARAARALGISQPALSRQIAGLEANLGIALFDRNRTGTVPTVFGRLVLDRAAILLGNLSELEREVGLLRGLEAGSLHVGAGIYPAFLSVGIATGRLKTRHPGLKFQVMTGDWRSIVHGLRTRELDLAVIEVSLVAGDPQLIVEPLPSHAGAFFCRAGHPLTGMHAPTIKQVLAYPLAAPRLPARAVVPLRSLLEGQGEFDGDADEYVPPIKVDTIRLAVNVVLSSDAISLAPLSAIRPELLEGTLVALPLSPPWLRTNYGLIYPADRSLSPAAEAFMREMRIVETELTAQEAVLEKTLVRSSKGRGDARSARRKRAGTIIKDS